MQIEGPPVRDIGAVGDTLQLRAIATLDDGTRPDVTAESTWTVTNPNVLSVSARGLVSAIGSGSSIVDATYRGRAGTTNVTVGPRPGVGPHPLSGVVRDAERGAPVVGAEVRTENSSADEILTLAVTDGNGFFNLGDRAAPLLFFVTQFGYADSAVFLTSLREPTHLQIVLTPNPGPYIERRVAGVFDTNGMSTIPISTRPGGVFDAIVRSPDCRDGSLRLRATSSGREFLSDRRSCLEPGARLRFVVPASDVELTVRGTGARGWELTYREPR
jgi:hypothetical protein